MLVKFCLVLSSEPSPSRETFYCLCVPEEPGFGSQYSPLVSSPSDPDFLKLSFPNRSKSAVVLPCKKRKYKSKYKLFLNDKGQHRNLGI